MNEDDLRTRIKNKQQDKTRIFKKATPDKLIEEPEHTVLRNDKQTASVNTIASIDPARSESIGYGKVINNRFVIKESLGAGGMGMVFRALDIRKQETGDSNPYLAMKILSNEFKSHPQAFVALQREAQKSQLLSHPNVITVYDFDRDGDLVYLTMEELKGQPLDELIREYDQGLPLDMAVDIIQAISNGLSYAHKKNIVHADLKPANIFYTDDKEVKIIDFGIAKVVTDLDSQSDRQKDYDPAEIDGLTPAYASLEMLKGERTLTSDDVYALGIISYEILTGKHPYSNKSAVIAKANKLIYKKVPKLKSYQWSAIRQALLYERTKRFKSASEFRDKFSGKGRLVRYLSFGIIAISLILAVSLLMPNDNNTDYLYDELDVSQQLIYDDLMKEGSVLLGFNDWNNALAMFDKGYKMLPQHSRTKNALNLTVAKILQNLDEADSKTTKQLKIRQINELLKYESLSDNGQLLEYKRNIGHDN